MRSSSLPLLAVVLVASCDGSSAYQPTVDADHHDDHRLVDLSADGSKTPAHDGSVGPSKDSQPEAPPASLSCKSDSDCPSTFCHPSRCAGGACVLGPPPCKDIGCLRSTCDENTLSCKWEPSDEACSDLNPCNGIEHCSKAGSCLPGSPLVCTPATPCAVGVCDPKQGCVDKPGPCPNGEVCVLGCGCKTPCITPNDCPTASTMVCRTSQQAGGLIHYCAECAGLTDCPALKPCNICGTCQ